MGAAWKVVLLVAMVGALVTALPPPSDGALTDDPVKESPPAKSFVETPAPVNPKRPPNKKDDSLAETRSENDRGSTGGFFEDVFNIPIRVLEAVRDMINNRAQYYVKSRGDVQAPDRKAVPVPSP